MGLGVLCNANKFLVLLNFFEFLFQIRYANFGVSDLPCTILG